MNLEADMMILFEELERRCSIGARHHRCPGGEPLQFFKTAHRLMEPLIGVEIGAGVSVNQVGLLKGLDHRPFQIRFEFEFCWSSFQILEFEHPIMGFI